MRRRLNTRLAVFNKAVAEEGLTLGNPFENLSIRQGGQDAKKREGHSMRAETFSGSGDAGHRRFKGLDEAMRSAGLLDVREARVRGGSRSPVVREDGTDEDHEHGHGSEEEPSATRFRAATVMRRHVVAHGIHPSEARVHCLRASPENPVVLWVASTSTKGRKVKGAKLDAMGMPPLAPSSECPGDPGRRPAAPQRLRGRVHL